MESCNDQRGAKRRSCCSNSISQLIQPFPSILNTHPCYYGWPLAAVGCGWRGWPARHSPGTIPHHTQGGAFKVSFVGPADGGAPMLQQCAACRHTFVAVGVSSGVAFHIASYCSPPNADTHSLMPLMMRCPTCANCRHLCVQCPWKCAQCARCNQLPSGAPGRDLGYAKEFPNSGQPVHSARGCNCASPAVAKRAPNTSLQLS